MHSPAPARALVGFATLALGIAILLPRHHRMMCTESTEDLTRLAAKDYADSTYMMWRRSHPGQQCPATLGELNEYTNRKQREGRPDISDSWGNDLRMTCDKHGVRVWSLGPDAHNGTADDIKSWE